EEKNNSESQERLNKKFKEITEALEDLQQENLQLRKPMDLGRDEAKERSVGKDQEEAKENLESSENQEDSKEKSTEELKNKAKKNQQSAAEKMRQLAEGMQMDMQIGDQEQMVEDARVLRQILDNLIVFSFSQED